MKILFTFSFVFATFICNGQLPFKGEISWGEPIESSLNHDPIGSIDNELFVLRSRLYKHWIESFNEQSLSLNSSHQGKFEFKGNKLTMSGKFIVDDKLVFITSYKNKTTNKLYYFTQIYEGKGKLSEPNPIATIDLSGIKFKGVRKTAIKKTALTYNAVKVVQSKDKKCLFVLYPKAITEEERDTYVARVFNSEMEEVDSYDFQIPDEEVYLIEDLKVSNEGVGYAMGRSNVTIGMDVYRDQKGFFNFSGNDVYSLTINPADQEIISEKILPPNNQDIGSIAMDVVDGGVMYYGLYGKREKNQMEGSFFAKFSSNGESAFYSTNAFDTDFVTQHLSEKQKAKADRKTSRTGKDAKLERYVLRELIQKENGELILTAEQYYTYTTTTGAGPNSYSQTNTHYVYNDVIVVNCDKSGTIKWNALVKKRQRSINDGGMYSSFFTTTKGSDVYLVFNTSEYVVNKEELENEKSSEKRKAKKNTVASIVSLDDKGEQKHEILFDFEDDNHRQLIPKMCRQMSDNEIFLFTKLKKRMYIMGLVKM